MSRYFHAGLTTQAYHSRMKTCLRVTLLLAGLFLSATAAAQACALAALPTAQSDRLGDENRSAHVAAGPSQLLMLQEAATRLSPLQCASVRWVAFVNSSGGSDGTMGWVMANHHQSILHLNALPGAVSEAELTGSRPEIRANIWLTAIETVAHESVHSAVNLLHTQLRDGAVECLPLGLFCDEPNDPSQWSAQAVELAREAVQRMRLEGGVVAEWQRLHTSFTAAGWASPYGSLGEGADLAEAGFMSLYGSGKPGEDIAEMAALASTHGYNHISSIDLPVNRHSDTAPACTALNSGDGHVSNRNAAVFTKLSFLRDLGLLSGEVFDACVGSTSLNVPAAEGFHLRMTGREPRLFGENVSAHMGRFGDNGPMTFEMSADGQADFQGESFAATARLRLTVAPAGTPIEVVSWPRGLYPFHTGQATFSLEVPDAPAAGFEADLGFALVTSASGESIVGALNLQRAIRPHTPLVPVPMATADLPTVLFRLSADR